jgi:hypothetical protein
VFCWQFAWISNHFEIHTSGRNRTISISNAKGHSTPKVTSPIDRATTVFYSCFIDIYRLSCTVSTLLALLLLPKMAERQFRPIGGVLDRKWSHRSIAWSRFGTGRFWSFSIIFYLSKVIRFFRFACKMPFENFGERIFFRKKFFSSTRPPKGASLEHSASFEISCVQLGSVVWSVGLVTKQKKVR